MDNVKENFSSSLEAALEKYKNTTVKLIDSLENDNYDSLEGLIAERQKLINVMSSMSYSKEEFKELCDKLEVVLLQHKLDNLMQDKRSFLRKEMDNLSVSKNANRNYTRGFNADSLFFNKKI